MGIASLAGLVLNRAQHTMLSAHCRAEARFPDWLSWNKLQIQAASVFLRHNQHVETWRLDVDDYLQWCTAAQLPPSVASLERYADGKRGAPVVTLAG